MKAGNIESNISGVAMGDSWISPIDSVLSWAPYLYQVGLVDKNQAMEIMKQAAHVKQVFDNGEYKNATTEWSKTETLITTKTNGISFYNILTKPGSNPEINITDLMNGEVKKALNIPANINWLESSSAVFNNLNADFMKPVINIG